MNDLFVKQSKKEQLLEWLYKKKWAKTSEVIQWGLDNYHTRAERDARDLATEGKISRMNEEDKNFHFNFTKEDVWVAEKINLTK